jgi:hypothetical protein
VVSSSSSKLRGAFAFAFLMTPLGRAAGYTARRLLMRAVPERELPPAEQVETGVEVKVADQLMLLLGSGHQIEQQKKGSAGRVDRCIRILPNGDEPCGIWGAKVSRGRVP